jgi:hypothetical protein
VRHETRRQALGQHASVKLALTGLFVREANGGGERIRTAEWRFCRPFGIDIRPEKS